MKAKLNGEAYDPANTKRIISAVADIVRRQAECGIDVVADGEQESPGSSLTCAKGSRDLKPRLRRRGAGSNGRRRSLTFRNTTSSISAGEDGRQHHVADAAGLYRADRLSRRSRDSPGHRQSQVSDGRLNIAEAFMPAVAPSGVGKNEYYGSEEEYLAAVGEAMREEYLAIVDAGFMLQIDDPWLTEFIARTHR